MSHPQLVGFPVMVEDRISWSDQDAFAHVSNIVYFRFFQEARIEYLNRIGWLEMREKIGIGPIVGSTQAKFRKPLTHPDRIRTGARVIAVEPDRVTFEHRIVSEKWGVDLVAEGQAVLVCFDYKAGKKTALPAELVERIQKLEGGKSLPGKVE